MPCSYYSPGEEAAVALSDCREKRRELEQKLDLATRVACTVITELEKKQSKELKHFFSLKRGQEARDWWARHKEMDEKRIAAKKREQTRRKLEKERRAEQAKLKKSALAKLSYEEKKALGI